MTCPLCAAVTDALINTPVEGGPSGAFVQICGECVTQLSAPNPKHFRALATTMWSEVPEVQVMAARTLTKLSDEGWARDLSDQLYLDEEIRGWAENVAPDLDHRDSNGVSLTAGDTVVLIKDLLVKGGGFTAKRGTAVHRISLVADNVGHIEGRVEGQRIVILTEFVKKR